MFDQLFDRSYFNPWGEFSRLHDHVNRLFAGGQRGLGRNGYPAVNVWSDRENIFLTAEVPGVDPKDLDISVHGRTVTLKGERKAEDNAKDSETLRQERPYGVFSRTLELPYEIDAEKVAAEYRNGVLQVKLARSAKDQPKKIAVKS